VLAENIAQVLIDMADALDVVHGRGYMHLDVKPENFLLSRNGGLRLIDFDLARPIPKPPRRLDRNPGTPHYMSPEQLAREPVDHRADIWAFGVSAYELLTLQKPFPGDGADDVFRAQRDRPGFIPPSRLNADIPPALERIVLRCLEPDPALRHTSMAVVAHELRKALYV
jgi:serine/threonine-protein kinase